MDGSGLFFTAPVLYPSDCFLRLPIEIRRDICAKSFLSDPSRMPVLLYASKACVLGVNWNNPDALYNEFSYVIAMEQILKKHMWMRRTNMIERRFAIEHLAFYRFSSPHIPHQWTEMSDLRTLINTAFSNDSVRAYKHFWRVLNSTEDMERRFIDYLELSGSDGVRQTFGDPLLKAAFMGRKQLFDHCWALYEKALLNEGSKRNPVYLNERILTAAAESDSVEIFSGYINRMSKFCKVNICAPLLDAIWRKCILTSKPRLSMLRYLYEQQQQTSGKWQSGKPRFPFLIKKGISHWNKHYIEDALSTLEELNSERFAKELVRDRQALATILERLCRRQTFTPSIVRMVFEKGYLTECPMRPVRSLIRNVHNESGKKAIALLQFLQPYIVDRSAVSTLNLLDSQMIPSTESRRLVHDDIQSYVSLCKKGYILPDEESLKLVLQSTHYNEIPIIMNGRGMVFNARLSLAICQDSPERLMWLAEHGLLVCTKRLIKDAALKGLCDFVAWAVRRYDDCLKRVFSNKFMCKIHEAETMAADLDNKEDRKNLNKVVKLIEQFKNNHKRKKTIQTKIQWQKEKNDSDDDDRNSASDMDEDEEEASANDTESDEPGAIAAAKRPRLNLC